ncbi:DHH family phosphoesterase [Pseudogracilibacillus sp. ICA-222130]|uniref:DHH family phosphoesterase n=1 Tax=Pseudogracilibacillus sp. ICA-222130 TaxID=3134655 RepID=UPI0030BB2174
MKRFELKDKIRHSMWAILVFTIIILLILFYYNWVIGIVMTVFAAIVYFMAKREQEQLDQLYRSHMNQLSYQVEQSGKATFLQMPIGIVIYNDDFDIKWANPYMETLCKEEDLIGKSLYIFGESLIHKINQKEMETMLTIDPYEVHVKIASEGQTLYFFDRTEEKALERRYDDGLLVLANIYLDNYEEISRNMDDSLKSRLNSLITETLNRWAAKHKFYIKRTSQERFIAVLTKKGLHELEETNFDILDEIREVRAEEGQQNPITISIGVGTGHMLIPELARLAQSSLDLALGRGGDQVAVRDESGKVRFYGGKTNPMEKRTRVRARVVSHALKDLVEQSNNVIIMGHKSPDMDSLGATIGVLNIAQSNGVPGYIVYDENDVTTGIEKVVDEVKKEENLWKFFIGPEEAEAICTDKSLVVVVDTHRPSLTAHEKLLRMAHYIVVIDHHRRGEEFVDQPTLVYMEPYASSTAELVTELIEYQPKKKKLTALEATAMLAGIIVDTKSFALRTGSRTFDAASYLRSKGADPVLIQRFLKEDLATLRKRNELIEKATVIHDTIAISKADAEKTYGQIVIAQAADTLLTVDSVTASFVIARINEDTIAISARSLGDVNVQLVMEAMDGGGHLTNAATQLEGMSIDEVEEKLLAVINDHMEGRT